MNKRRLCTLIPSTGLAAAGLLFALLLLSQRAVWATPDSPAVITAAESSSPNSPVSAAALAGTNVAQVDASYLCSGVWVTRTVGSAGSVGSATSLALEPSYPYTPHISYYDGTNDNLKHAWLDGTTWLSETVDFQGGGFTSLALVPTYPYTPCISYYDDEDQLARLRYACRESTTWTIMKLSAGQLAGRNGTSLALAPTYPYTPHISCYNPLELRHAYLSGTGWMTGTWVYEVVEPPGSGAGWWSSLALEASNPDTPHISYYKGAVGGLKYAWLHGTTWVSETVDSGSNVGWYTSLALDSDNNPHISYFDDSNDSLKYARLSGGVWFSETVDSIGSQLWGSGTSLELNQADVPYISYYDGNNGDLKLAYFNGTAWIKETVDSLGDVGLQSSLALDAWGCPHISYYDATNDDLKYAYIPPFSVYMPIIMKN